MRVLRRWGEQHLEGQIASPRRRGLELTLWVVFRPWNLGVVKRARIRGVVLMGGAVRACVMELEVRVRFPVGVIGVPTAAGNSVMGMV